MQASRSFLLLPLALLAACSAPFEKGDPVSLPSEAPPVDHGVLADEALAAEVDAAAQDFLARTQAPGVSLALVREGELVFSAGYGWAELESERAFEAETPVLLSSVSKTFIGVAAMQALEDEVLTLDEPVAAFVDFEVDNPKVEGEQISLRDLLTHNSGIEDSVEYGEAYASGDPELPLDEFLRGYLVEGGDYWRAGNYAKRMPGDAFAYSNVGASLAAHAIAQAQGMDFMELVETQILTPLGMDDSAYLLAELPREPAVPYSPASGKGRYRPWPHYGYPTYPDGMLRASATDMGRYLAAIASGGVLEGVEVLDAASVEEMLTVDEDAGTDESGQAIAWAMREGRGHRLFGHNGGDYGSTTELWFDRETGTGFVVLLATNLDRRGWKALIDFELRLLEIAG